MNFLEDNSKGQSTIGKYILGFILALFAFIITQFICQSIATSQLGFSLLNAAPKGRENLFLIMMLIPFAAFLTALVLLIKPLFSVNSLSFFTARKTFDWKRFFTSFAIWGGVMTLSLCYTGLTSDNLSWHFNAESFFGLLTLSLFLIPIQTTAEEFLFRSYLMKGFYKFFGKSFFAILLSGTLFGLMHAGNPEVSEIGYSLLVYYISTGIFLGIITVMDDGIELGAGYHAVNNIFGALIVTTDWQVFQTDALFIDYSPAAFTAENWLMLFIIQPLLVFLFAKIYRWKNWKKKLFH